MDPSQILASLTLGYLLGSVPFSHLIVRLRGGPDLREVGSRNVGGSNAIRTVGWGWGAFASALDIGKGLAALALVRSLGIPWPVYALSGLAAMVGHNYPIWLRFRGGKGVAVAVGLSAWVALPETLAGAALLLGLFWWTRNITVAVAIGLSLTATLTRFTGRPPEVTLFVLASLGIMLIAILPEAVRMARTPGALRQYFRLPRKP